MKNFKIGWVRNMLIWIYINQYYTSYIQIWKSYCVLYYIIRVWENAYVSKKIDKFKANTLLIQSIGCKPNMVRICISNI